MSNKLISKSCYVMNFHSYLMSYCFIKRIQQLQSFKLFIHKKHKMRKNKTNFFKLKSADVFKRLLVVVQIFELSLEIRVMLVMFVSQEDGMFVITC